MIGHENRAALISLIKILLIRDNLNKKRLGVEIIKEVTKLMNEENLKEVGVVCIRESDKYRKAIT